MCPAFGADETGRARWRRRKKRHVPALRRVCLMLRSPRTWCSNGSRRHGRGRRTTPIIQSAFRRHPTMNESTARFAGWFAHRAGQHLGFILRLGFAAGRKSSQQESKQVFLTRRKKGRTTETRKSKDSGASRRNVVMHRAKRQNLSFRCTRSSSLCPPC